MKRRNLTITVPGSKRLEIRSRQIEVRNQRLDATSLVRAAFANAGTEKLADWLSIDPADVRAVRDWVDRLILEVERKVKND